MSRETKHCTIPFALLFGISVSISIAASAPAAEEKGKAQAEKEFGESLILKMTELNRPQKIDDKETPAKETATPETATPETRTRESPATVSIPETAPTSSVKPKEVDNQTFQAQAIARIDQLSLSQPQLPKGIDLCLPELNAGPASIPNAVTTTAASTAENKLGYPKEFLGSWSGRITIDQHEYAPEKQDQPIAVRETALLHKGRSGQTTVRFEQSADGKIQVTPPSISFAPCQADLPWLDKIQLKRADGKVSPVHPSTIPAGLKFNVNLGSQADGRSLVGAQQKTRELLNSVIVLSPTEIEQEIATSN